MNIPICVGQLTQSRTETPDFTNTQSEVKHSPRCWRNGDIQKEPNRDSGVGPREVGVMRQSSIHHHHSQTEWARASQKRL